MKRRKFINSASVGSLAILGFPLKDLLNPSDFQRVNGPEPKELTKDNIPAM